MDLLLVNKLINVARREAETLGVPLSRAPAEVDGEPGKEMLFGFPARGGKVFVRMNGHGEPYDARYRRSLLQRLLRP